MATWRKYIACLSAALMALSLSGALSAAAFLIGAASFPSSVLADAQSAVTAIKEEQAVKDLLYDPSAAVKWHVGVTGHLLRFTPVFGSKANVIIGKADVESAGLRFGHLNSHSDNG